jgi:putative glutamine amidotransferase
LNGSDVQAQARPVIGMTTYLQQAQTGVWDVNASFLPAIYIEGVNRGGGTVVLLPPQPDGDQVAERVLDGLDGLVITGGRDVDPTAYGQPRHASTDEPVGNRDQWEFTLVRAALRRGLPLLGICRGAQVLNVALGGTLHQNLPDVLGHTRHQQGNAVFSTSSVQTVPDTRLAALIGDHSDAQCYHHQAIDRLGDGLVASARDTTDGVIEAVELPGDPFVLAVQWHPEERLDDIRLFSGLVEAARSYATERVS